MSYPKMLYIMWHQPFRRFLHNSQLNSLLYGSSFGLICFHLQELTSFLSPLCSQRLQCLQTFEYPSVLIRCRASACNGSKCAWVSYQCSLWGESGYGPENDPLQELYRPIFIRLTFFVCHFFTKSWFGKLGSVRTGSFDQFWYNLKASETIWK